MLQCCATAEAKGLTVEKIAVIDSPDPFTEEIVRTYASTLDIILPVEVRDLGSSRNAGREASSGNFLTFFDGDDLWGEDWIWRSHQFLTDLEIDSTIVHPRLIYYFSAEDYLTQSLTTAINPASKSFYFIHEDSDAPSFDPRAILLDNLWTANSFCHRQLFERFPYEQVDHEKGYGVEDWLWNAQTLASGMRHAVAPNTVHCVRLKQSGSLGMQNVERSLLPPLHRFADKLEHL